MRRERDSDESNVETARLAEGATAEGSPVLMAGERRTSGRRRALFIAAFILVLVVILVIALVWRPGKSVETTAEEPQTVVSVRVAKAEKQRIAAQVSAPGTIFPRAQAQVSAKISAQIRQMPLLKNRFMRAGDVIAVLESSDLQAQRNEAVAALEEARSNARSIETGAIPQNDAQNQKALRDARAAVASARAIYERRLALYQKGGISKKDLETSELDLTRAEGELHLAEQTIALRLKSLNPGDRAQAAARVHQAEQRLRALDAQLSYAVVRAPITGVVIDQALYKGSFASAGATLVTIGDTSQMIVKAPFADTVAAQLKIGDAATVLPLDLPGERMTGQIALISRAVDPASRTVEVWVTLGNEAGRLRVNGAAQVIISTDVKSDAVVVAASAVVRDAANSNEGTVMVVDAASVAHETKVAVGIRSGDRVEITAGLQGGETVVIEGNYALPDGTKVEASETDEGKRDGTGEAEKTGGRP
jgi:multidrug efflux pump subunit AcrA (membrane-fusion protein)